MFSWKEEAAVYSVDWVVMYESKTRLARGFLFVLRRSERLCWLGLAGGDTPVGRLGKWLCCMLIFLLKLLLFILLLKLRSGHYHTGDKITRPLRRISEPSLSKRRGVYMLP